MLRALLVPWHHVVFDLLFIENLDGPRKVHTFPVVALVVFVLKVIVIVLLLSVNAIDFSIILLAKGHENNGPRGCDCVHNEGR